jgi:hypothetical protein
MNVVDVAALEQHQRELKRRLQGGELLGLVDEIDSCDPWASPLYLLVQQLLDRGRPLQEAQRIAHDFFDNLERGTETLH